MEIYAVVNGIKMSHAEYKAYRKAKAGTAKVVKKQTVMNGERLFIRSLADEIARLYKKVGIIESIQCFYRNGYSQWGNSFRIVVGIEAIRRPMVRFMAAARKINPLIKEIENLCKRGSKCVFQLIENLTYMLDDVRVALRELCEGVRKSSVLYGLATRPCICEKGKRLGLAVLMSRSEKALFDMDSIIGDVWKLTKM